MPMAVETNPYESPAAIDATELPTDLRRPPIGTFLVGIWLLEGGFKAYLVGVGLMRDSNPLHDMAQGYHAWNRVAYFLVTALLIIETIGPWIGVYYLTGRRARTIAFERALLYTLAVAGVASVVLSLVLMLYLELTASMK